VRAEDVVTAFFGIAIIFVIIVAVQSWLFMLLWNWIVPLIFSLPHVSFFQAFGILALLNFIGGCFRSTWVKKED